MKKVLPAHPFVALDGEAFKASAEQVSRSEPSPTIAEIGTQLRRILGTVEFAASTRSARFLTYIVERTLAGEARMLKQYSIATEALGRDSSFDPDHDPLVRLEAGKLRRNLDGYYANHGAADPVRIAVPRGSYVPSFEWLASPRNGAQVTVLGQLAPTRLLVVQTSGLGPEAASFSQGLTEQLTVELARYRDLSVAPDVPILPEGASPAQLAHSTRARFVVTSSARQSGSRLRAVLKLHDLQANAIIWTDSFDGPPDASATIEAQDAIARRVSAEIADFHGVICRLLAFESVNGEAGAGGASSAWSPHTAIQRHRYLARITNEEVYRLARADLEEGVRRTPYSAMMWGALAHTVFTGNCLGFDNDPDFLQAAERCTQRAIELDETCAFGHVAAATIAMYRRDLAGALETCRRLAAGNVHAPSTKLSAGFFRSLAGDWDEGALLMRQALAVISHPPGWAFRASFLNAYRQRDYLQALYELKTYPAGEQFTPSLLRAAAFGQLGRTEEAELAVAEIHRKWPDFPRFADRYFRYLSGIDALSDHLREGLLKARLDS
jgi:TolB-like protein